MLDAARQLPLRTERLALPLAMRAAALRSVFESEPVSAADYRL